MPSSVKGRRGCCKARTICSPPEVVKAGSTYVTFEPPCGRQWLRRVERSRASCQPSLPMKALLTHLLNPPRQKASNTKIPVQAKSRPPPKHLQTSRQPGRASAATHSLHRVSGLAGPKTGHNLNTMISSVEPKERHQSSRIRRQADEMSRLPSTATTAARAAVHGASAQSTARPPRGPSATASAPDRSRRRKARPQSAPLPPSPHQRHVFSRAYPRPPRSLAGACRRLRRSPNSGVSTFVSSHRLRRPAPAKAGDPTAGSKTTSAGPGTAAAGRCPPRSPRLGGRAAEREIGVEVPSSPATAALPVHQPTPLPTTTRQRLRLSPRSRSCQQGGRLGLTTPRALQREDTGTPPPNFPRNGSGNPAAARFGPTWRRRRRQRRSTLGRRAGVGRRAANPCPGIQRSGGRRSRNRDADTEPLARSPHRPRTRRRRRS